MIFALDLTRKASLKCNRGGHQEMSAASLALISHHLCRDRGKTAGRARQHHVCISRESSPGHINGNDVFYHWTTDASGVGRTPSRVCYWVRCFIARAAFILAQFVIAALCGMLACSFHGFAYSATFVIVRQVKKAQQQFATFTTLLNLILI